jgi:hypothetical protein
MQAQTHTVTSNSCYSHNLSSMIFPDPRDLHIATGTINCRRAIASPGNMGDLHSPWSVSFKVNQSIGDENVLGKL